MNICRLKILLNDRNVCNSGKQEKSPAGTCASWREGPIAGAKPCGSVQAGSLHSLSL